MKMNKMKTWGLTIFAAAIVTMIPEISLASGADDGGIGESLCNIAEWFTGDTGRAIATVAIIFLGIAAFFGKVTWGLALMFAVGVFAIFGANEIVQAISSGEGCAS